MTLQQNIKTVIDRNFTETKNDIKEHAANSLFKDAYEYTRMYRAFVKNMM